MATFRRSIDTTAKIALTDWEAVSRAGLAVSLVALGDAAGAEREIARAQLIWSPLSRGVVARRVVVAKRGRLARCAHRADVLGLRFQTREPTEDEQTTLPRHVMEQVP